ncbi:MAG TPA: threonine ammonia-lyase [Nitrospiraceae bacterium]|jgi:threonine dehydratase|nr:threonine ammonia-lyase [Nitrospiraceae bacterium]
MVNIKDIREALRIIRPFVHKTPLIHSTSLSAMTGAEVYLKGENLQKTGSFKVRGAFYKMHLLKDKKVIAASMGNHAQGVAFAASRLGIQAKIVMPVTAPIVKEEATRGYGAEVVLYGESFKDALGYAVSQEGYIFVHPFDDDGIIAGQGTVGVEILEELEDIDALFIPVGGGGLISGVSVVAKTLSPKTEIIGVQTESATSAYSSFHEKKIMDSPPLPTLADGIAVGRVGDRTFEIMGRYVDDIVKVSEDAIAMAILLFLERKKLVVEGAGAVTLAGLWKNKERFKDKRVVLVVSGGNIDFTLIDRIIHKGLIASGRIGVFEVVVNDVPGSLHVLTGIIASHRGNVLHVVHERFAGDLPVGKTRVIFTVETHGKNHGKEILSDLGARGFTVKDKS